MFTYSFEQSHMYENTSFATDNDDRISSEKGKFF